MPYNLITDNNGVNRNIQYINRNFSEMRASLIDFAKTYFPTTVTDFSPSSPGMMFIEMASYVGDVMAFYTDNQIQENFIQYAKQTNNLYDLAYMAGYKPSVSTAAITNLNIFQTVPAIFDASSGENVPDFRYSLVIDENTPVNNSQNTTPFLTQNRVDFSQSSSLDPTTVSVYQILGDQPTSFLLTKTVPVFSATINTTTFTAGAPERFSTYNITAPQILSILDITDSDGNIWSEVDYLAQETIFETIQNINPYGPDPNTEGDSSLVSSLLRLKKVPNRFVSRFIGNNALDNNTTLQIQFGAGTVNDYDEQIIPNPNNVGIGLPFTQNKLTTAYSPNNFIFTKTYGVAPSNTTLTVRYLTGGGVTSNVSANTLTFIDTNNVVFANNTLDNDILATSTFNSLQVTNPNVATGGGNGDTIEDLRKNSMASYASQLRNVTPEDYLIRTYSLPSQYGSIAKAYIEKAKLNNTLPGESESVLDLYISAYNKDTQLINASNTLKSNLSTYLSQYRMIGDSVRIKDAFVINIGINFEIVVLPNFNSNQVLIDCINQLKSYFNIDNMQINQPILINELYNLLLLSDKIRGVQNVKNIEIINKAGVSSGYSQYAYDTIGATQNNVLYPSQDPSIFEVKFPDVDIKGRVLPI